MAIPIGLEDDEPVSAMNTTPLIDVMLVLLVMFIITIPLQSHAVKITLPGEPPPITEVLPRPDFNTVTIDGTGVAGWNGAAIDLITLRKYLEATRGMLPEPELHVKPDANARYDIVDQVLEVIKRSQITKVGFVGNDAYSVFGKAN